MAFTHFSPTTLSHYTSLLLWWVWSDTATFFHTDIPNQRWLSDLQMKPVTPALMSIQSTQCRRLIATDQSHWWLVAQHRTKKKKMKRGDAHSTKNGSVSVTLLTNYVPEVNNINTVGEIRNHSAQLYRLNCHGFLKTFMLLIQCYQKSAHHIHALCTMQV